MENLLTYLIVALFKHNVTNVYSHDGSGQNAIYGRTWTFELEDHVMFSFDGCDLDVIRSLYEERKPLLFDSERKCFEKVINLCV